MELFLKKNQEIGLLEIKCPQNKRNLSIEIIITDKTFSIVLNKGKKPYLKKEHNFGYYTQIQVAMGLAGLMVSLCCLRIHRNDHCES